jgi:hypothetical protein
MMGGQFRFDCGILNYFQNLPGLPVKRNSYDEFLLWLRSYKLSQK